MNKRIKNKLWKNSIIIFDRVAIPDGLDIEQWYLTARNFGIIIWDSENYKHSDPNIPIVIPRRNSNAFKIINTKGKKYKFKNN